MTVQVTVKHNLKLLVKTVDEIKPKLIGAMKASMETSLPYTLGQLEKNAPPEAQKLAQHLQARIEYPDPDTVRGIIFSQEDPLEAFVAIEFGTRGVTIRFQELIPIVKKEGERPVKPIEKMSRKEREDWEKYRIVWVWSKKVELPPRDAKPWLIPTFRNVFPEIVERLRNRIAFSFEEVANKNAR